MVFIDNLRQQAPLPPADFLQRVLALAAGGQALPDDIETLALIGLPAGIAERLLAAADSGQHEPEDIIAVFVALLATSPAGAGLSPDERDLLAGTVLQDREQRWLRRSLQRLLDGVTADNWDTQRAATT